MFNNFVYRRTKLNNRARAEDVACERAVTFAIYHRVLERAFGKPQRNAISEISHDISSRYCEIGVQPARQRP